MTHTTFHNPYKDRMWCYCIMYSDGTTQYLYSANYDYVTAAIAEKCNGTDIVMDFLQKNPDYPFEGCSVRLPVVNDVKHGEWIFADEWKGIGKVMDLLRKFDLDPLAADIDSIYCSCCGAAFNVCDNQDTDRFNYCPECGAKMEEK